MTLGELERFLQNAGMNCSSQPDIVPYPIDGQTGYVAYCNDNPIVPPGEILAVYYPKICGHWELEKRFLCGIYSNFPLDEGTRDLLNTFHIKKAPTPIAKKLMNNPFFASQDCGGCQSV
jgi:hypothetical protein